MNIAEYNRSRLGNAMTSAATDMAPAGAGYAGLNHLGRNLDLP